MARSRCFEFSYFALHPLMKKLRTLFFLILFLPGLSFAKTSLGDTINISNIERGLDLDQNWKFKIGDDISWAESDYPDQEWAAVKRNDSLLDDFEGILWCRTHFIIDTSVAGIPLAINLRTNGACDVFIDGKYIRSLGVVGKSEDEQVSGFSILPTVIPVPVSSAGRHVIAIRTSGYGATRNLGIINIKPGLSIADFETEITSMKKALEDDDYSGMISITAFFSGVFLVLCIFHFILFLYYRKNRANLYYSLFTFFMFIIFFGFYLTFTGTDLKTTKTIFILEIFSFFLVPLFYLGILYEVFYKKLLWPFYVLSAILAGSFLGMFVLHIQALAGILLTLFMIWGMVETIRVIIRAAIKRRDGSRIFIFGLLLPVIGVVVLAILAWVFGNFGLIKLSDLLSGNMGAFFGYSLLMSASLSMTIYLAREFARMNNKLHSQISEIKQLFDKTIEQDAEKKKILENQNEELERMVAVRTQEVLHQKSEIELKNRDILDNLLYARRIQEAILPEIRLIYEALRDSFIIYWPKDIVSGDFYSFSQRDGKVIIAAADCTGHGVTGAFMSMIGSSMLNQIINQRGIIQPSIVLNNLNVEISEALKQNDNEISDGMDIALCAFDLKNLSLQYSGSNRPLWIFRKGELFEVKPDKMAIGGFRIQSDSTFTNHEIRLQEGDAIYLFTDGYVDQFGGPNGKKLLSKRFRELLSSIQDLTMKEQEKKLTSYFEDWRGDMIQVDDVLVIGIRI